MCYDGKRTRCEHTLTMISIEACPTRFCLAKTARKGGFSLRVRRSKNNSREAVLFGTLAHFSYTYRGVAEEHSFNTNRNGGHHSRSAERLIFFERVARQGNRHDYHKSNRALGGAMGTPLFLITLLLFTHSYAVQGKRIACTI